MNTHTPTALIAEDEAILAQTLGSALNRLWPELQVLDIAHNGPQALEKAQQHTPEVLFLDIRMPGANGLEVAADLADAWPPAHAPTAQFPLLVFVTAYEQYAVAAFEAQAADYVLKPWREDRLQQTVQRLQARLAQVPNNSGTDTRLQVAIDLLRPLMAATSPSEAPTPLRHIAASAGHTIHYVDVDAVLAFQAADKYVRVITAEREYLIRTPLKDILAQLRANSFWQIHRSNVICANALDKVTRDESGRLTVHLKGLSETFAVSRLFASQFKAM